jgi:hypothetical protein
MVQVENLTLSTDDSVQIRSVSERIRMEQWHNKAGSIIENALKTSVLLDTVRIFS